jgi:hypothetical protein
MGVQVKNVIVLLKEMLNLCSCAHVSLEISVKQNGQNYKKRVRYTHG